MIFLKLFLTFFKIGLFTFGGGYAMLPLIESEVQANDWLSSEEFINFIAVSETTPGPFAINIATYIGNILGGKHSFFGGLLGAFCATLGVVLPSFIIILFVASVFEKFKNNKLVSGAIVGLRPAVIGLIGSVIFSMTQTVLLASPTLNAQTICLIIIFIAMLILALKKLHPIIIILISAVLGVAVGFFSP